VTECPHYNATDGKYLKGDGTDLACAGTGFTVAFANKVEGSGDTPCDDVRGEHRRAHRPRPPRDSSAGHPPDILRPLPATPVASLS